MIGVQAENDEGILYEIFKDGEYYGTICRLAKMKDYQFAERLKSMFPKLRLPYELRIAECQ